MNINVLSLGHIKIKKMPGRGGLSAVGAGGECSVVGN